MGANASPSHDCAFPLMQTFNKRDVAFRGNSDGTQ